MSTICHLMGTTCAGKSTIINALAAVAPEIVYPLQIGKALRAKYGEAYFQGQAAPEKTRVEAISMYRQCISDAIDMGHELIVVDGQPRDVSQAIEMASSWRSHRNVFVLVHAEHAIREERARTGRTPGPDLELAVARLSNDYRNNYDVMTQLLVMGKEIKVIDTGTDSFDINDCVDWFLNNLTDTGF